MGKFDKFFRTLRDPRAANSQHGLVDILFIALAGLLCGAESAADMERFGHAKQEVLRSFGLERGIPSHDTFSRVFRMLDPAAFERAFHRFVRAFARANKIALVGVIAIDGKSLRRAYERGKSATPLHLVNAFAAEARLALASRKAPQRNEMAAALDVLRMLRLEGNIVTADALFCSRSIADLIRQRGGHYALALKGNQSNLFAAVANRFSQRTERSSAERSEPSTHGRREWRRATVIADKTLAITQRFPGIAALGRITSRRQRHGAKTQITVRYYLLSRKMSPKRLLHVVRSRWSVENNLHWMLDVVLREDASRARKDHAGENLAILRKLALNLLQSHPAKFSLRQKVKSAGWNDNFLLSLLAQMAHMR